MLQSAKDSGKTKPGHRYVAFDIQGDSVNEQLYRIIPFDDIIRSQLAFMQLSKQGDISGRVTFLSDTDKIYDQGGLATVRVPSFSDDKKEYTFNLEGLCLRKTKDQLTDALAEALLKNAFRFYPHECCPRVKHFVHFGRWVDEVHVPK